MMSRESGRSSMISALRAKTAFQELQQHFSKVKNLHLRDLFRSDQERGKRFALQAEGIYLDYSKHRITDETMGMLIRLAEECDLRGRIEAMFRGEKINVTENRAV